MFKNLYMSSKNIIKYPSALVNISLLLIYFLLLTTDVFLVKNIRYNTAVLTLVILFVSFLQFLSMSEEIDDLKNEIQENKYENQVTRFFVYKKEGLSFPSKFIDRLMGLSFSIVLDSTVVGNKVYTSPNVIFEKNIKHFYDFYLTPNGYDICTLDQCKNLQYCKNFLFEKFENYIKKNKDYKYNLRFWIHNPKEDSAIPFVIYNFETDMVEEFLEDNQAFILTVEESDELIEEFENDD